MNDIENVEKALKFLNECLDNGIPLVCSTEQLETIQNAQRSLENLRISIKSNAQMAELLNTVYIDPTETEWIERYDKWKETSN